jgi:predicted Fe-Mo cluster-binding NifX family protein
MMNTLIAVPSQHPGGLSAAVSDHFGHCDAFTIIALQDGKVTDTRILPTPPHGDGGCLVPVGLLADSGVTAIVARGMGGRPLMGFLQSGIQPLHAEAYATVEAVVAAYVAGKLKPFSPELVCGGGGHDHDHGGGCCSDD